MLDQISDLDINNAAAGTYNGKIEIDLESGVVPTEKQLEYIINYDLHRHADVIPGWTTRPENWSPIKVDQLNEPYNFQMPKAVEDIFVHNMQCPECQHHLRQAPGGVYCEYCGWTPHYAASELDPNYWTRGGCSEYALALHDRNPTLQFGRHVVYDAPEWEDEGPTFYTNHVFVHDDKNAYDALGTHPLPYILPGNDTRYDENREDIEGEWDIDPQMIEEAHAHIENGITPLNRKWYTGATVEDSEPPQNFGFLKEPHNNLYPAAWADNEKMRPDANKTIKQHVLKQLAINHYEDADDWIYFTVYGSGASYNWDEDGDFDVQMWIDFEAFNDKHPNAAFTSDDLLAEVRRVVQMVNFPSFKEIGLDTPECEGRMLIQFYPKPGKGTPEENLSSKPYACYDMETDEWLQKPRPITPTFYGEHFIMVFNKATDIAIQAEALLDELERNTVNWQFWSQMYNTFHNDKYETIANDSKRNAEAEKEGIKVLFQGVFGERQKAYSPDGEGIEDEGDLTEKLLEVWGIFQRLKHFARQPLPWEEQELPKEPEDKNKNDTEDQNDSGDESHTNKESALIVIAGWSDIMEDAQQLRQESGVQITHNGAQHVEGIVQSQSSPGTTYATSFERQDPNSQAITQWTCTCPWGEVSWGRTRQWKKYEGRPCKHLLALYWQSLATPLDENQPEAQGQGQLFNPQQLAQPGPAPLVPGAGPTPAQVPNAAPPGTPQAVMPLPPTGVQAPPPPPAQSQITKPGQGGTVSIPGTLSKVRVVESTLFENGGTVRNRVPMYGTTRDGYTMLVPAGQRGTVLFSDDSETIAIFPLNQAGILEPHLVRVQEPTIDFAGAQGDPFVHRHSKLLHYR